MYIYISFDSTAAQPRQGWERVHLSKIGPGPHESPRHRNDSINLSTGSLGGEQGLPKFSSFLLVVWYFWWSNDKQ